MPRPLVSAIVANWNGARDLEICLPTLLAQSYDHLEIIVVDNASTDDSSEVVRTSGVGWLPLERNLGLAGALNQGARAAHGEFVLFLNNDMRFDARLVECMVGQLAEDPTVFSVDALQYDWNGERKVHLATRIARKRADISDDELVPGLYVSQNTHAAPTVVLMSSAANMLARKSMFLELGGFDERLPIGCEDVELCWRAWIRGWKTVFAPSAICWHRIGASTRTTEGAGMRFRGIIAGRLLMATKHLPLRYVVTTWLACLAGLARDASCLRWNRTRDQIRLLVEYAGYFPDMVHERREIYRAGGTSPKKQLKRLLRVRAPASASIADQPQTFLPINT